MGRPSILPSSSLERLKELTQQDNTLSLETSIQEASILCNHGTRAELILKWLHAKLQKDQTLRDTSPNAWKLYGKALSLLTSNKLASIVSSDTLARILTVSGTKVAASDNRSFYEKAGVLAKLLQRIHQTDGAPIKALLSYSSITASDLAGSWLAVLSYEHEDAFLSNDALTLRTTQSSLRLWALRKPGEKDNELFAKHMLPAISSILASIEGKPAENDPSRKRKRDQFSIKDELATCKRDLERLVAQHVFMPARTAFFATAEKSSQPEVGQEEVANSSATDLEARLSGLRKPNEDSHETELSWLRTLPVLMDIALRCVSLPTARQKLQEQPWVETLYTCLSALLSSTAEPSSSTIRVHVALLEVVRRHGSMSMAFLKFLVERLVEFENDDWEDHLELCAKVIELDSDVFALDDSNDLGGKIFEALSKYGRISYPQSRREEHARDSLQQKQTLLKDRIAVPLLRAAAKTRHMDAFIQRWRHELSACRDLRLLDWFVWAELDDASAELLEQSTTQAQISGFVSSCHEDLKTIHAALVVERASLLYNEALSKFNASAIVLKAIVAGTRSDDLKDKLFEQYKATFDEIARTCALLEATPATEKWVIDFDRRLWPLLRSIFEIWFPRWAASQTDASSVEERAIYYLDGSICDAAVDTVTADDSFPLRSSSEHRPALTPHGDRQMRCLAAEFLACLCSHFVGYQRCEQRLKELCAGVEMYSPTLATRLLIAHPEIHEHFSHESNDASDPLSSKPSTLSAMTTDHAAAEEAQASLAAFADNTSAGDKHVEGLVDESIHTLTSANSSMHAICTSLEALESVPLKMLSRQRRERIVDACTAKLDTSVPTALDTELFVCIGRLLKAPHATATIATDASVLIKLACIDLDEGNPSSTNAATRQSGLELLAEIVTLTIKPLVADPDRGKRLIEEHCVQLRKTIKGYARGEEKSRHVGVIVYTERLLALYGGIVPKTAKIERVQKTLEKELLPAIRTQAGKTLEHLKAAPVPRGSGYVSDDATDLKYILQVWHTTVQLGRDRDEKAFDTQATELIDYLASLVKLWVSRFPHAADDEFPVSCMPYVCELATSYMNLSSANKLRKAINPEFLALVLEANFKPRDQAVASLCLERILGVRNDIRLSMLDDSLVALANVTISPARLRLLRCAVHTFSPRELEDHPQTRALLPALLQYLQRCVDYQHYVPAFACVSETLRTQHHLTNQFTVEQTLVTLQSLIIIGPSRAADGLIFLDACSLASGLLLQHRSRLQGRYHLVISLSQTLLTRLFNSARSGPGRKQLGTKHAHAFTRLLTLFCNPPTPRHHSKQSSANGLVDETRKARARVGEFVPTLLHLYCAQVLQGTLGEGVRQELLPGLWAVIESMEVFDVDAIKVLSASMNSSERAVLRDVYEEWRRVGKWQGG